MNVPTSHKERKTANKRVAIYTRQSVDRSTDSDFGSLQAQREAIESFISSKADEGWQALPHVYEDAGYSGKNTNRPAFQRMMSDLKAGRIDIIAVYKFDRLARTVHDLSGLLKEFLDHDASCISITQPMETVSATGRAGFHMMCTFAQLERELASERTKDKIRASREKGMWCGGYVSLGYKVVEGKLVIDPDEAKQAKEVFEIYLKLGSLATAAKELNRRGWKTKRGANWGTSTLSSHLNRVLYTGKVPYHDEVFEGQHKAIVNQELFDDVQELLRGNGHAGGSRAKNKWNLLLRGLLVCGGCGLPMGHTYTRKKEKLYHYYICRGRQQGEGMKCQGARLNAHEIDQFVIGKLECIGKDENVVAATVKAALAEARKKKPTLTAEKRTAANLLKKLQKERKGLLVALAKDRRATGAITDRLLEIDQEVLGVETRVNEIKEELEALKNGTVSEEEIAKALNEFDEIWHELLPKEKQRLLSLLVEEIRYEPETGNIAISYHPAGLSAFIEGGRHD